ncbi:MAG: hypothetical protein MUO82_07545 [Candidatus Thermoplasmatota archaeon]|nr:hypothetical protein [Candidatus Thermoplasmatota archaeon]
MDWYMRFNIMRERPLINRYKDNFAGIIVDAHVLESFAGATSRFLSTVKKPFIIDPVTYKFSTYNSLQLFSNKRWYPKLFTKFYDGIIEIKELNEDEDENEFLSERPAIRIEPEHFEDEKILKNYVNKVLSYQRTRVSEESGDLKIFEDLPQSTPLILIPPYDIIMKSINDEWLTMNVEFVKKAIQLKNKDEKIFPVIAIYKDLIHRDDFINNLVTKYNIDGVDGYFVWVSDFKETREDQNYLSNYFDFFRKLKSNNKPIINFYGGYMSMVASSTNILDGFSSAIGYGEYRNPFTEGGPAPEQYYLDLFHTNVPKDEVNSLLTITNHPRCNCEKCQIEDLEEIELMDSLEHLLLTKIKELQFLNSHNINQIKQELQNIIQTMEHVDEDHNLITHYRHISRWLEVLNNLDIKR